MKQKIKQLKNQKNAVILAHYYAPAEVQAVADYVGDSFYLAKVAKQSSADMLVFCGVSFMGESAKILNPEKKVLVLDPGADCPMAHMVKPGRIQQMRDKYEDLAVVCYINSTTELMAVTGGYHYHTIRTESESVLDRIEKALSEKGFLAPGE